MVHRVEAMIQGLTPAYFALVMASGIISLGFHLTGDNAISEVLFGVCSFAFVVLCVLNLWRFIRFRHDMASDLRNPQRAFGFFTFVAAANVLGSRAAAGGSFTVAAVLLAVSTVVWVVLGYVVPWTAVLGRQQRPAVASADGTWFIWVVASQSVAISAATLEGWAHGGRDYLAILAVLSWSVGVFLYAITGIVVIVRLTLYPMDPSEFKPPYWVSMGAVAITVVAGARIVDMESAPMVDATRDFVAGASVTFWAFATWLIPPLVALGVWRHWSNKVPLRYEPSLWSMIFPLGMYAVAGIFLGRADRLPVVEWIGSHWLWVAVAAWTVVFVGMLKDLFTTLFGRAAHSHKEWCNLIESP